MTKKEETFKFTKKNKIQNSKNSKIVKAEKNGKEYSQLFMNILNSNKSLNINNNTKFIKNNKTKKNNIKKITLFTPEELKCNYIYSSQKSKSKKLTNNIVQKNNSKIKNNINKQQRNLFNEKPKIKINNNYKYNTFIKKEDETNETRKNNIKNKVKEIIQNNIKKQLMKIDINLTEKDLKLKNEQNKKEIKNNIKTKKVDILNDGNIDLDNNKNKMINKNNNLNYIFRQKYLKNYEVNLNNITTKNKIRNNKCKKENESQRIIDESLNIIDSFSFNNHNTTQSDNKNKKIDENYYNKLKSYPKYIYTDISQSVLKLSNNNTEMNTMNSSRLNEISPFELNKNPIKGKTSKKKKLIINKSENIKNKIKQKFNKPKNAINDKQSFNKKLKNINEYSKKKLRKFVKIKVRNINDCYNCETEKLRSYYPRFYFHKIQDYALYSQKSYNNKKEWHYSLFKNTPTHTENNTFYYNREINNMKRKYETVRNNIDNIGKKLLILVHNFHDEIHILDDRTFNIHSGKLIDRIRTIKKLNNIY